MQRCLHLAKNAFGNTYPNPMVGCVIVHNGNIIGEGWHRKAGEAHAEVNAINSVKDKSLLQNSTLYVNLEPCSHYGKTPPCCELILSYQIQEVIVGSIDPFSEVSGSGIERLKTQGTKVIVGVLEEKCKNLNKRFFTFHQKKRPYIILKWANSLDGLLAPKFQPKRNPIWITGKESQQLVHKWRSEETAILVGTRTALFDNPKLNVRSWYSSNNPVRLVIDKSLQIPKNSYLFDGGVHTIVLCKRAGKDQENLCFQEIDFSKNLPKQIGEICYKNGLQSLIVEGGAITLQAFIDENFWDEARVFTGKISFGDGLPMPVFSGNLIAQQLSGEDQLKFYQHD